VHDRITEIQVMFIKQQLDPRIKGFARVIFDNAFFLGDLRILEKTVEGKTHIFLAMPSRYAETLCAQCNLRTPSKGTFCMYCGTSLSNSTPGLAKRSEFYVDTFHPMCPQARYEFESLILKKIFQFRNSAKWAYQNWYNLRV
jgi:DNA-binding cell septation regulator SpoVG